ncbi:MAG: WcbI family polysaccharide biosynthesis putative acetyltransferase [Terracoccus sp.]
MPDFPSPQEPLVEGRDLPDGAAVVGSAVCDPARAWHYGEFYGLKPVPDEAPLLVVHGNCQAESLRILLQQAPDSPCASVRIPPVHELHADEVPLLQRLLRRAAAVVVQPIAGGYHDLPLGTEDVRRASPVAEVVVFPVFRYAGLLPCQVVHTDATHGDPPVVPYHDVCTLLRAAGRDEDAARVSAGLGDHARAVSQWSLDELARRESASGSVVVSDLVTGAGARSTNTINHPGNPILVGLAQRVEEALGWPTTAQDPGRELLDSIHAPLDARVLAALGLDPVAATDHWRVGDRELHPEDVARDQIDWYRERPAVLEDLLGRSATQLRLLGVETGVGR